MSKLKVCSKFFPRVAESLAEIAKPFSTMYFDLMSAPFREALV